MARVTRMPADRPDPAPAPESTFLSRIEARLSLLQLHLREQKVAAYSTRYYLACPSCMAVIKRLPYDPPKSPCEHHARLLQPANAVEAELTAALNWARSNG